MSGPDVYRLARAFPPAAATALAERALGKAVAWIQADAMGGGHAVYFIRTVDGEECVVKVATHPEHELARELWAAERCRAAGVPVPRVVSSRTEPGGPDPPFAIMARAAGVPAYGTPLTRCQRDAVFEELGRYLALIHRIPMSGFGELKPCRDCREGYAGQAESLWEYLMRDLDATLAGPAGAALSPADRRSVRERFAESRSLLDRPAGCLVHGDFRFKNTLLDRNRVTAILDFEMALSGDPAMDVAWLLYSDAEGPEDITALQRGYAPGAAGWADPAFGKRILLYQIRSALGHLYWTTGFQDEEGTGAVLARLHTLETSLAG